MRSALLHLCAVLALLGCSRAGDLPSGRVLDGVNAGDLEAIVAARAVDGVLVFFQFESVRLRWLEFAQNAHHQLAEVWGYPMVALGAFAEDCQALERSNCVTHSYPARGTHEKVNIHGMWAMRYDFLTRLLARNVTALMLDVDQVLHEDILAYLQSGCLLQATLVFHYEGGGPNGGFAFARPSLLALELLGSVVETFNRTGGMDQEIIGTRLRTYSVTNTSTLCGVDMRLIQGELVAGLPESVIRFGEWASHWHTSEMTWKVTHLLKVKGTWQASTAKALDSFSHVGRQAYMMLFDYWDARIFEKYRGRKPVARIHPDLITRVQDNLQLLRQTVKDALLDAANTGHLLVLPRVSCNARWVESFDPRLLWGRDDRCYLGVHSYEECWPWDWVVYDFDPLLPEETKVLSHFPNATHNEVLMRECKDFFL